jgi:uncharacterized protein (DUF934 family)
MRRIIRRREIVEDELRYAGEPMTAGTVAAQTVADWIAAAGSASAPAAVVLSATDEVEALGPHLHQVRWIVIEFAKIGEGRGYSQARMLRQRYRYAHQLRARGAIKRDQLFFLARCGFDAFDLDPFEDLAASLAAFNSFSVACQGGEDAVVSVRRRTFAAPLSG